MMATNAGLILVKKDTPADKFSAPGKNNSPGHWAAAIRHGLIEHIASPDGGRQ